MLLLYPHYAGEDIEFNSPLKPFFKKGGDSTGTFKALKHARDLFGGRYTTVIAPKLEWLEHADHAAYPVKDVPSSYQMCPDDEGE